MTWISGTGNRNVLKLFASSNWGGGGRFKGDQGGRAQRTELESGVTGVYRRKIGGDLGQFTLLRSQRRGKGQERKNGAGRLRKLSCVRNERS